MAPGQASAYTCTSQGIFYGLPEVFLLTHGLVNSKNTGFRRVEQVSVLEDFVDTSTIYFVHCSSPRGVTSMQSY